MNKSVPIVGIAKWPNFTFNDHMKEYDSLKTNLRVYFLGHETDITDEKLSLCLKKIELALSYALLLKKLPQNTRAEIKKELESISLEKIVKRVKTIPEEKLRKEAIEEITSQISSPLKGWLCSPQFDLHKTKSLHDVAIILEALKEKAHEELSGAGRAYDIIPILLAVDVAKILTDIGIDPFAIRPASTTNFMPNPSNKVYTSILKTCFELINFHIQDLGEYIKKAQYSLSKRSE